MKNKFTLIFGSIFVLLIIIYFAISYKPREVSKGGSLLFPDIKPLIEKIEIGSPSKGTVILEKKNSIWRITSPFDYKASNVQVEQAVTGILNIYVDGVISSRKETQAQYNVGDESGISLKAYSAGETVLDVIVGKGSVDLTHTYVRESGSDDIVMWRGIFGRVIDKEADDWRDKNIYSYNADDVMKISVTQDDTLRVLTREDTAWTFTENGAEKPVDESKVTTFVNMLATLSCDTFAQADDIPKVANNEPDTKISFEVRNGDVHTADVWTPEAVGGNRFLLREHDGEVIFAFFTYRGQNLIMNYSKLMP